MPSASLDQVITRWQRRRPHWFASCRIEIDHGGFDGWSDILDEALISVEKLLGPYPDLSFQITQIKEKCGSLRIYYRQVGKNKIDHPIGDVFEQLRARSEIA